MATVEELNAEGNRAREIASAHVDGELYVHAVERYARAVDLEARLWAEWVDLGRPLLVEAPNGVRYAHPLIKMYRDASTAAAAAARAVLLDPSHVKHARPGRPLGAASAPDRVRARNLGPSVELNRKGGEPPKVEWRSPTDPRYMVAEPL